MLNVDQKKMPQAINSTMAMTASRFKRPIAASPAFQGMDAVRARI
jgi:hypothetical protein